MAKYTKIQPDETVDAIQIPKECKGQPDFGGGWPFVPAGSWIVNEDNRQYILTDNEFQQRFRPVESSKDTFKTDPAILGKGLRHMEQPTHVIYDPAIHELIGGKLVHRKAPYKVCRKCKQVIE